jgi:hypothetical protein
MIEQWQAQMQKDFAAWVKASMTGEHNRVLDHTCALYNAPCPYMRLCASVNPERLIEGNYTREFWNPLTRERKGEAT